MRRLLIVIALIVLGLPGGARAGSSAGESPFNFLFLDAGARAVAMGGAYTALSDDANALHYNPAGLGRVSRNQLTFMHNEFFSGISQQYIGLAMRSGLGFNLNYFDSGDIPRTTLSNPTGAGLGNTGMTDLAFGAGYGRALSDSLSLGAGVKIIRESIDDVRVSAYAADFGVLLHIPDVDKLRFGFALQNIGPSVTYIKGEENLPLTLRLGAAYGFTALDRPFTAALDLAKTRAEKIVLGVGAESYISKRFLVRAGFNTRNNAGFGLSAGMGWKAKNFSFDYAFVPFGDLGDAHRLSVGLEWGGADRPTTKRARVLGGIADEHMDQALTFIDQRKFEKAAKQLRVVGNLLPEKDPLRSYYYERLGFLHLQKREFDQAKAAYIEALRIAIPKGIAASYVAEAYLGLGECLIGQKDLGRARRAFRKTLEIAPTPKTREKALSRLKELRGTSPGR